MSSSKILVVNCSKAKYDVYIGRAMPGKAGSLFANPFKIGADGTREEVIEKYETWLRERLNEEPDLVEELLKLDGKILGCWCAPKKCHGDVIVKLIRELSIEKRFLSF